MPRPSRHLDRALIAAGRALLPRFGCAGLTVRQVTRAARVNIGMFHYHFRTREAFLRAVLQDAYEEMFARFSLEVAHENALPAVRLRAAFRVLGRFLRDNRPFVTRVLGDGIAGDPVARDFMRDNLPRHLTVLARLLLDGQRRGAFLAMPIPQALGFCAGALALPIIVGGAIAAGTPKLARELSRTLLTDDAIDQRIDLALAALKKGRR